MSKLYYILTCFLLVCQIDLSFAIETAPTVDIPNTRLTDARNHISDPDSIISEIYEDSINNILNILEDSTGIEVAVVTVKNIGDNEVREFATELFNKWGLGKKGEDNGLLILIVTDEEQRAVVFETGYGIEGILPDILCSRIQKQYMLKYLKDGNYGKGLLEGVKGCTDILLKNKIYEGEVVEEETSIWTGMLYLFGFLAFIYVIFFIIGPLCIKYYKKAHPETCPACGEKALTYESNKVVKTASYKECGMRVEKYICKNCGHIEEKKITINKLRSTGGAVNTKRQNRGSNRSNISGGSWGGGRSGGGGSMTKF